jgi:hypothetical protein
LEHFEKPFFFLKMIRANILFEKESLDIVPRPLESLRAPTVYTGQKIKGFIRTYYDEKVGPMFDAVELLLRGVLCH